MRVSTSGMHYAALNAMMERSAALSKTQTQIASGKRVQTPADDPVAAVHILELERALQESEQYGRNAAAVTARLSYEEQKIASGTDLLQKVRDLTVQANSAALDSDARKAIVTELQGRLQDFMDIANSKDINGEFLFSGYSTLTQPFSRSGTAMVYNGDQGVRMIQTSETQRIADSHTGSSVFLEVTEGNGTFVTTANQFNAGTGSITGNNVVNAGAWTPDNYNVRFLSPTSWEVVDSTNTQVATGTFTPGGTIDFNGVQITLSGQPATGDSFNVAPAGSKDMFTMLDELVTALARPTSAGPQAALFASDMGQSLTQIDRALEHFSAVRAQIGSRLNAVDRSQDDREDRKVELNSTLSDVRDLDYAQAVTELNLQLTGLQAAQASYSRIAQLSLFDYL